MTDSEKLLKTLNFEKMPDGGSVVETFFPWDLTVNEWCDQGLPKRFHASLLYPSPVSQEGKYLNDSMADPVHQYEQYLGFDGVKRMAFRIPFKSFEEENEPVVRHMEDWLSLKKQATLELEKYCTDENIRKTFSRFSEGHKRGDFSIRFRISGFFWTPRELLGIQEHMMAFYDEAEMLKDMNQFVVDTYIYYLGKIFDMIQPEVILLEEDLSGSNGPMLSPNTFEEFVAPYYQQLVPFLKEKGVKNVFVDTDGDFNLLIPNFIKVGVDGFLPMDVNAGMDIVKVRDRYPGLKFIGAFNKLEIAKGKAAIDQEFDRLLPVIRQGGYVPGCDHQVAPSTSYEDYCYYIKKLREVMKQAGADR